MDILNLFDPATVSEVHQRSLLIEQQHRTCYALWNLLTATIRTPTIDVVAQGPSPVALPPSIATTRTTVLSLAPPIHSPPPIPLAPLVLLEPMLSDVFHVDKRVIVKQLVQAQEYMVS